LIWCGVVFAVSYSVFVVAIPTFDGHSSKFLMLALCAAAFTLMVFPLIHGVQKMKLTVADNALFEERRQRTVICVALLAVIFAPAAPFVFWWLRRLLGW